MVSRRTSTDGSLLNLKGGRRKERGEEEGKGGGGREGGRRKGRGEGGGGARMRRKREYIRTWCEEGRRRNSVIR